MKEMIYYKSPVGALCLKSDQEFLASLEFVNAERKPLKTDEAGLKYKKPESAILQSCIKQLDDYFAGKLFAFDLKLSQEGSPFQQKVWNALLQVKYGKTESYLQLSKRVGDVKAIRAVGTANGRNDIAIIVPCHRIIGSNGSLVGYGGDLWRKKWLLEHEAKYANGVQTLGF